MSFDDQFGGFLDRETVLAGMPAKRANTLMYLIESRAAHLKARSRQATEYLLSEETAQQRDRAFLEAFALGGEPPLRPTIRDLERYASQWALLVPDSARIRAALAHRLGEKYEFTHAAAPNIRAALGLDETPVQQAYESLYRRPLEDIYAQRTGPVARLHWAWAALAGWLENLPAFWTAYGLTLTETVGVTILALPIAVAGIGPLAGVAILLVLGAVNTLTVALMSEAVARSGTIRYGSAYIGRVVDDYLGRVGSFFLTLGIFVLCFLVLQSFYVGFSSALQGVTGVPAVVWAALLFLVGLYFLKRETLGATVASALVVGAINIVAILILSLLAFTQLEPANLFHVDLPFIGGRSLDSEVVGLVFGVILTSYFGHLSVSTCARVVLRRDPSSRSLIQGTAAAQATAVILYCIFVLAVNGAVAPEILGSALGTSLDPLADEIGPIVYVLGTVLVVFGLGMGSIHFSLALFNVTRERLPSLSRTLLALPRRRGRLLFQERRGGLSISLTYLGLAGGKARFRLETQLDGGLHRVEKITSGRWEITGPNGEPSLLDRFPRLCDSSAHLALEVLDADGQRARLRVTSSMRQGYEGAREEPGLNLDDVLALSDSQAGLVGWMMRQGKVTLAEVAEHTADQDQCAARSILEKLVESGHVTEIHLEGKRFYEARMDTKRGRWLPREILEVMDEREDHPSDDGAPPSTSSVSGAFWGLLSSRYGRFIAGASPVVAAFLMAECLLLTGAVSFAGLLAFVGAIIIPLLCGIFPVLLLIASRHKGERVPETVYRFLGNRVLLAVVYVVFLLSVLLHGLVIWEDPLQRGLALSMSMVVVWMTIAVARRGAFNRRFVVELREDPDEQALFCVTAAGCPALADVRLEYSKREETREASSGAVPDFSLLRRATFRLRHSAGAQLKVWAHRVTPEEDSESVNGVLRVRQGHETKLFDLTLSKGQVVLPVVSDECEINVTLVETDEAWPGERLL